MKHLSKILIAFLIIAVFSCCLQQEKTNADTDESLLDFSQFYHVHENNEYIYDAHRNVPIGKMIVLKDLDSIFGTPMICDTIIQTSTDWSLQEQECRAAKYLPKEIGDTLVMMRRIYGNVGDWLIWIDLEIQNTDSLRVLGFIAYDNSQVEI